MQEISKMKLVELKAACIHWKHYCDPELLADNDIPEIKSNLSFKTYKHIAIWLYVYIEHKYAETFMIHSSNLNRISKGFRIIKRREYWHNLGILGYTQLHATTIFMNAIDHYNRILIDLQERERFAARPRPHPRKFNISVNVCKDMEVQDECPICYDSLTNDENVRNQCGHSICIGCFDKYMDTMVPKTSDPCCSVCRCVIDKVQVGSESILNVITKYTN